MCEYNDSLFESEEFFLYTMHFLVIVTTPFHVAVFYCLILKTPDRMKPLRFSMLLVHVSVLILDIHVSFLGIPNMFLPIFGGYGLGILQYFNVPSSFQLYFGISLMCASVVSIVVFLENRYQKVTQVMENVPRWKTIIRVLNFSIQYVYAFGFMVPIFLMSPDQEFARNYLKKHDLACISEKLDNPRFFALALKPDTLLIMYAIAFLMYNTQMTFYVSATRHALNKRKSVVSAATFSMQAKLYKILTIQALLPVTYFGVPVFYFCLSMYTGYFNQAFNNFAYLFMATHGSFASFVTIVVHKPYRQAIFQLLYQRRKRKVTTSMIVSPHK